MSTTDDLTTETPAESRAALRAEIAQLRAEVERLQVAALDVHRIRLEHALLVRVAGQPSDCGACGAAVMPGHTCEECGADPSEIVP